MTSSLPATTASVLPPQKVLNLARRHRAERRFRLYGIGAVSLSLLCLVLMLSAIIWRGVSGFYHYEVTLTVKLDQTVLDPTNQRRDEDLAKADYGSVLKQALYTLFPDVTERKQRKELHEILSAGAEYRLQERVSESPELIGQTIKLSLPLGSNANLMLTNMIDLNLPASNRPISDATIGFVKKLQKDGLINWRFNLDFLMSGDSRSPELAGIGGALAGSFFLIFITLILSFPLGVFAAIYMEEFAKRNRFSDFLEVNINNLAAVPSIVYGLLGLALFLNLFGLPRSTPLVGGLVLSLMTMPVIIIASRSALRSVPPSIREAALGLGASHVQTIFHHVLPLAMPGILTGTIIGMARALGETAPLLMIGMVAFIMNVPTSVVDAATTLPVQIYLWADSPERGYVEKTSAAILVLVVFLVLMNLTAIILRQKFSRRW